MYQIYCTFQFVSRIVLCTFKSCHPGDKLPCQMPNSRKGKQDQKSHTPPPGHPPPSTRWVTIDRCICSWSVLLNVLMYCLVSQQDHGRSSYQYVELRVHSNHGEPLYTCIYYLQVPGSREACGSRTFQQLRMLSHIKRAGMLVVPLRG